MKMNERGLVGRAAGVLVLLGLALSSCGKTAEPGSGETHFLQRCQETCGGGYECLCGVCTRPCDGDAACSGDGSAASCTTVPGCVTTEPVCDVTCTESGDCASLGSDFQCAAGVCRQPPPQSTPVCPSDCYMVTGYPLDGQRDCFDLSRGQEVACQCGEPAPTSACRTRTSDDSSWMLPEGMFADPSAWGPCATDASSSCDFADCELRPSSFCSVDDFCGDGCGNAQFFSDGCRRAECQEDGDCPADERCVTLSSIAHSTCSYSTEGTCNCAGPTIDLSGAFCNPISEVGPGGAWQEFNVVQDNGLCIPDACRYEWHVTSDGQVIMRKQGVESSATLSDGDLEELDEIIDGPELRAELAARECMAEDLTITYELVLPAETLLQHVASCVEEPGDVYARVWEIVQRY